MDLPRVVAPWLWVRHAARDVEPYSRCPPVQPALGKGTSAAEAAEEMAFSNRLNIWVAMGLCF